MKSSWRVMLVTLIDHGFVCVELPVRRSCGVWLARNVAVSELGDGWMIESLELVFGDFV